MVEVGGGTTILILLPFLVFGVGIIYMAIAAGDRRGRPPPTIRNLAERRNHPLRHVQIALNSARKQAHEAARRQAAEAGREEEPKPKRKRRSGPRWLRRV